MSVKVLPSILRANVPVLMVIELTEEEDEFCSMMPLARLKEDSRINSLNSRKREPSFRFKVNLVINGGVKSEINVPFNAFPSVIASKSIPSTLSIAKA